jgi:hypothetical protein
MMGSARLQPRMSPNDGAAASPTVPFAYIASGKPCGMLVLTKSGFTGHCALRPSRRYLLQRSIVMSTEQVHT